MSDVLYAAWQDPKSRSWKTFGRLIRRNNEFEFSFTKGASSLDSLPFDLFGMNPQSRFVSSELLSLFRNKLPPRSRSDFAKMARWLNVNQDETDFQLLRKFGLIPGTDSILIYPEPEMENGCYSLEFFVHGIRHMSDSAIKICSDLGDTTQLFPMLDVQNDFDANAIALRPKDSPCLIGYVPIFYSSDLRRLLGDPSVAMNAKIKIVRNNVDAPIQLRLLCRFTCPVPPDFVPLREASQQSVELT
ncbi:MAG: hypothetical protein QM576_14850 [Rhodopseudomonas sp.]|uniref:HIRAN domain-containing protein n=1 Tax=Rhodopseudomonas sp. TaxID=1078 RepID=UPI0039E6C0D8